MITDINSEDRLVQLTFAAHLEKVLGWQSVYAYNAETFGPNGTLGRTSERDVVLVRDLRAALERLNPDLPASAREQAIEKLTRIDFARSLVQHNREFYREVAEPLNQQRANLYRQNEKLRTARDLLLPRLMTGEIAV